MKGFRFGKGMPKRKPGESEADYTKRVKEYTAKLREQADKEGWKP